MAANIIFDRELTENGGFLREVADTPPRAFIHGRVGDVGLIQAHRTFSRRHETDNHVEGRGFAGTVGPEEADDFPRRRCCRFTPLTTVRFPKVLTRPCVRMRGGLPSGGCRGLHSADSGEVGGCSRCVLARCRLAGGGGGAVGSTSSTAGVFGGDTAGRRVCAGAVRRRWCLRPG